MSKMVIMELEDLEAIAGGFLGSKKKSSTVFVVNTGTGQNLAIKNAPSKTARQIGRYKNGTLLTGVGKKVKNSSGKEYRYVQGQKGQSAGYCSANSLKKVK